jgi:alpha-1,2-mannosyltransferase
MVGRYAGHCLAMTASFTSAPLCMYRTSPTLNILLYNAIGGSGDELYGIEPASYYVKNLLLNMGVAWPLVLLSPLVYIVSCSLRWSVGANASTVDAVVRGAVLHVQALIWLAVLFSRPHKVTFLMFIVLSPDR